MTLTRRDDSTTLIDGTVADQSERHGAVRKLSDIGVPLVPVTLTGGRGSRNLSQTHTHCEEARMTGDAHNSTAREQRRPAFRPGSRST